MFDFMYMIPYTKFIENLMTFRHHLKVTDFTIGSIIKEIVCFPIFTSIIFFFASKILYEGPYI